MGVLGKSPNCFGLQTYTNSIGDCLKKKKVCLWCRTCARVQLCTPQKLPFREKCYSCADLSDRARGGADFHAEQLMPETKRPSRSIVRQYCGLNCSLGTFQVVWLLQKMIETACVNKDLLMGPLRFSTGQFPHVGFFFSGLLGHSCSNKWVTSVSDQRKCHFFAEILLLSLYGSYGSFGFHLLVMVLSWKKLFIVCDYPLLHFIVIAMIGDGDLFTT